PSTANGPGDGRPRGYRPTRRCDEHTRVKTERTPTGGRPLFVLGIRDPSLTGPTPGRDAFGRKLGLLRLGLRRRRGNRRGGRSRPCAVHSRRPAAATSRSRGAAATTAARRSATATAAARVTMAAAAAVVSEQALQEATVATAAAVRPAAVATTAARVTTTTAT